MVRLTRPPRVDNLESVLDDTALSQAGRASVGSLLRDLAGFTLGTSPWDFLTTYLLDRTRYVAELERLAEEELATEAPRARNIGASPTRESPDLPPRTGRPRDCSPRSNRPSGAARGAFSRSTQQRQRYPPSPGHHVQRAAGHSRHLQAKALLAVCIDTGNTQCPQAAPRYSANIAAIRIARKHARQRRRRIILRHGASRPPRSAA
jgi:hypothetical protein